MNKQSTEDFKNKVSGIGERTRCAVVLERTHDGAVNAFYNGPVKDLIILRHYLGQLIQQNAPKAEPFAVTQSSNPPEDQP